MMPHSGLSGASLIRLASERGKASGAQILGPILQVWRYTEVAAGHQRIAAGLWKMVARNIAFTGNERDASGAYAAAHKCLSLSQDSAAEKLELYREWFGRVWQARRYGEAIDLLRNLEDSAQQYGFKADAIAAMDQRGVCLQELGKHAEGEALHRAAAAAAETIGNLDQQERSLNNLGEALRSLGRDEEAIQVLNDSESSRDEHVESSPQSRQRTIGP